MNKLQRYLMAACTCVAVALACDDPERPTGFGSIALQIVSTATVSSAASSDAATTATAPAASATTLALDGVRVTVNGPTPKTVTSTSPTAGFFDVTLDQLAPGQYTVIVEGIVNTETDFYGSVSSVAVTSGQTATATVTNFATFVPVLADFNSPTALSTILAKWSKVPTATGYVLQVSNNPSFTGAAERSVPDSFATITAPDTGLFFVRVRASNAVVAKGRATVLGTKTFRVVPVPTSVRIAPGAASLVGAGTQQTLTAQAFDANTNPIFDFNYAWTSLNTNIVTVGASSGQATAVAAGQATVTATAGTVSASAVVNVASTGAPAVNVWSSMTNPAPSWLWSTWGLSPTNVYAVGTSGTLLNFNGTTWSAVTNPATGSIRSIWGVNSSDIFAAVQNTTTPVLHYNGTTWTTMTAPAVSLYGVWGSSSRDVFAAGAGGNIIHYNGTSWTAMTSGTTNDLWSIWGSGPNDVFASGVTGTLIHYNGTAWSSMTHPGGTAVLYRVWGTAADNVYAVGSGGLIMRYNGSSWSLMTSGTAIGLYGIGGTSSNEVFAGGDNGTILRYNGTSWSPMTTESTASIYGVWAAPGGSIFAVTENGSVPRILRGGRGAASTSQGEPTILGTTSAANWSTDYLISVPITITSTMEVTTLAMIGRGPANQGRLALYSDVAGDPSQLIAQTGTFNISGADPTTYEVPVVQQARITPGTYWVAFVYNNASGTPVAGVTTGGAGYRFLAAFGFGTAFPATYPASGTAASGIRLNYYAKGFLVP